MTFALAFLGSFFALIATLAVVYTYIHLRLLPKLGAWIQELGTTHAGQILAHKGEQVTAIVEGRSMPWSPPVTTVIVFTCEDHGRCAGCPKVLAQFEAIAREQGVDSMTPDELDAWNQLRTKLGAAKEEACRSS